MKEKQQPILNKYDIHNVESKLNDFITETVIEELKCRKVVFLEYFKLVFGAVFSAIILLSYFHKTPFPMDKPLISLCVVLYGMMNLVMLYYNKFKLQGAFNEFMVDRALIPKAYDNLKGKNDNGLMSLKLKSEVQEYSNLYTIKVSLGERNVQETIAYNEFIDDEGFIVEHKLKHLTSKLLKAL